MKSEGREEPQRPYKLGQLGHARTMSAEADSFLHRAGLELRVVSLTDGRRVFLYELKRDGNGNKV
jgi:hypothetical protein